ncbi:hypothetical protein [Phenylobacterium sp.]|jgi:hypothetical protein|uniref:hypothetical protein n=1 Tax=Phenylobacterium sp. TaxID=1871053 RepID=UPI002E2FACB1|nr:hypothetical protein [Phenylobacterium sp.]HEX2560630.1 hypothetical protein [Phenylobacterium sp.]
MDAADTFVAEERDGILSGPVRRPVNVSRAAEGSIHDDGTAQALGFRGGTVAGNIHMEQFPPLMVARFGSAWWRTGGLSLHFLHATTDGEPVQAFVGRPESGAVPRAEAWMETPEGVRVCEGTAWLGGDDPNSALRLKLAAARPAAELRILASAQVGDEVRDVPSRLDSGPALVRLDGVTEPLPEYRADKVAAPAVAIDALRAVEAPLFRSQGEFVGLFGAIELQFLAGPVFLDRDYLADGRVVGLSESPKTEIAWYESVLREADGGRPIARLLMMSRLLKASSPLWG